MRDFHILAERVQYTHCTRPFLFAKGRGPDKIFPECEFVSANFDLSKSWWDSNTLYQGLPLGR